MTVREMYKEICSKNKCPTCPLNSIPCYKIGIDNSYDDRIKEIYVNSFLEPVVIKVTESELVNMLRISC